MGSEDQALTAQTKKIRRTIITPKVRTSMRKVTLEDLTKIYLNSEAIHVMKEDTLPNIVLETKINLIRRRETREYIMLMLQKMMNLPQRESSKKVIILQVMNNMF